MNTQPSTNGGGKVSLAKWDPKDYRPTAPLPANRGWGPTGPLYREVTPRPLAWRFDGNVWHSQAFGCWGYIQVSGLALFLGSHMPFGFRFVWQGWRPRLSFHRFGRIAVLLER